MILPQHIVDKMTPEDRKRYGAELGKPSLGLTTKEATVNNENKREKEIQRQIAGLLTLANIPYINPPMNRRSQLPEGWPDFTFATFQRAYAIEVKIAGGKPRPEQEAMHRRLRLSGWKVAVVTSLEEFKKLLTEDTK
jgi:hypothetical protein